MMGNDISTSKADTIASSDIIPNSASTMSNLQEVNATDCMSPSEPGQSPIDIDVSGFLTEFAGITIQPDEDNVEDATGSKFNVTEEARNDNDTKQVQVFPSSELRNGKVIGEGGFGRVLSGNLHGIPVAIKIFHAPIPIQDMQGQLRELTQLKHRNVVNILGIVKSDVIDCPQIVLEFIREGNLLQYLTRRENSQDFTMLGKLAYDVADSLEYLHSKNIIHGNLAARNILIERVSCKYKIYHNAKISDYGVVRCAEGSGGNYMKVSSGRVVPVRWVPKELVEDNASATDFTPFSDVWSFGVLLWEMWTKGAVPYGASYSNLRVVQFLKEGFSPLKIHRPTGCPDHVVSVMERIFRTEPKERPSFFNLKNEFKCFRSYGLPNIWASGVPPMYLTGDSSQKQRNKNHSESRTHIDPTLTVGGSEQGTSTGGNDDAQDATKPKRKRGGKKHRKRKETGPADKVKMIAEPIAAESGLKIEEGPPVPKSLQFFKPAESVTPPQHSKPCKKNNNNPKGGKFNKMKNLPPRFSPASPPSTSYLVPGSSTADMMIPQAPPPYTPTPAPAYSPSSPGAVGVPYGIDYSTSYGGAAGGQQSGTSPVPALGRRPVNSQQDMDYREKIEQLESQIEALKTEKITTDFLKNSAEFATLMQQITVQRFSALGSPQGQRSLPHQQFTERNPIYDRPPSYDRSLRSHTNYDRSQPYDRSLAPGYLKHEGQTGHRKPFNNSRRGQGASHQGRGRGMDSSSEHYPYPGGYHLAGSRY